jgi:hypothetical protein
LDSDFSWLLDIVMTINADIQALAGDDTLVVSEVVV